VVSEIRKNPTGVVDDNGGTASGHTGSGAISSTDNEACILEMLGEGTSMSIGDDHAKSSECINRVHGNSSEIPKFFLKNV
jgi:hypothetical protein